MKKKMRTFLYIFSLGAIALQVPSCTGKPQETKTDTTAITPPNNIPKAVDTAITITADDQLKAEIVDATKDFPGVSATVSQGEITLTGNITRDKLPQLMQSLNALHPKKINNNLTIK